METTNADHDSRILKLSQIDGQTDGLRVADGLRIALIDDRLIDVDSGQWQAALEQSGIEFCSRDEPDIDWIVFDSLTSDVETLRSSLDTDLLTRVCEGQVQLVSLEQLNRFLDRQPATVRSLYTPSMLAELLGVPMPTIRRWHRQGLIQPVSQVSKLPYFDFQEVAAAKQIATLVDLGIQPATLHKNLTQLSRWLPDVDRPLAQLSILVEGKSILLRQGDNLVEPGGQLRINFGDTNIGDTSALENPDGQDNETSGPPPVILSMHSHAQADSSVSIDDIDLDSLTTFHQHIQLAEAFEQADEIESAVQVYRSAMLAFGPDAETSMRLGELLYRLGQVEAACERYFVAVELDESLVEARAALGCVLVERGETELAISAFEGALDFHPDYCDVHFHLANLYQSAGNGANALKHWRRFRSLNPSGPWADEAEHQIESLLKSLSEQP